MQSQKLRKIFRREKSKLKELASKDCIIKNKFCLDIELAKEKEDGHIIAANIIFNQFSFEKIKKRIITKAIKSSKFELDMQAQIKANTREKTYPFLHGHAYKTSINQNIKILHHEDKI